jgi:hypothetical protein
MQVPTAPAMESKDQFEIVSADGTGAAKQSKRQLRHVGALEQLSGKALLTTSPFSCIWGAGIKAQWRRKQLKRG